MTTPFPHLLAELQVGPMQLANRMVMGAMHTRIETLDRPIDRLVEFYRARAAGGIGLILTGGFAPHPDGRMDPESGVLDRPEAISEHGHDRICEAVHEQGGRIVLQILHAGRYAKVPECVGPSAERARINKYEPRVLSTDEVRDIIDQFARTARLAQEAGYDGVEIMGSEGYLLNEFMSPRTNDRTDEFGGDLDGRFRLPVECVRAIREAVGPDFAIIYRISAIDLVEKGSTADEVIELAHRIEAAGADAFNTGIGWHESGVPTIAASVPRAAWRFAVQRITDAVGVPVIASNRINTPQVAEELVADGVADLVSMARPLLADPEFARKVADGRTDDICPCIGCNQACLDAIFTDRAASCMTNPKAGRELDFLVPAPAVRKRVAVVGAGPAGLAFAATAAERGHAVTLYEESDTIGGQINYARVVPGKSEFDELLRYFAGRLDRFGVDVRLGTTVDAQDLAGGDVDVVVIATGVTPRVPEIEGIDHPKVVTYTDVLSGSARVGDDVAIIGAGGIGFDVAEYLLGDPAESLDPEVFLDRWSVDPTLERPGGLEDVRRKRLDTTGSRAVTLLQRKTTRLGRTLGKSTGWILKSRLAHEGVAEVPGASYVRIDDDGLHYGLDGEAKTLPCDNVVICAGQESRRDLYDDLVAAGVEPVLVGGAHTAAELDAVAAIDQATRAAYDL